MAGRTHLELGMLPANRTALFMCDLQTKFKGAMHHWPEIINNAKKLVIMIKNLR